MMHFLNDISFSEAIWLLPILYIIHFFEELPRFPVWATESLGKPYTRPKFIVENLVLWVICTGSVFIAVYVPGRLGTILVLSAAAGFFLNVIFHATFTLKTGVYSPGTVTACLFFAPASLFLYYLAEKEGLLTVTVFILSLVLGLAVLPAVVVIVHNAMDSGVAFRKILKKIVLLGLAPFVVISIAMMIFGRETVHKFMLYTSPLILLPLAIKIFKKIKEKKQSNTIL